jgi:uncharacterized membrane protein (DUF485 family)
MNLPLFIFALMMLTGGTIAWLSGTRASSDVVTNGLLISIAASVLGIFFKQLDKP